MKSVSVIGSAFGGSFTSFQYKVSSHVKKVLCGDIVFRSAEQEGGKNHQRDVFFHDIDKFPSPDSKNKYMNLN